jgi:hypothetical protein
MGSGANVSGLHRFGSVTEKRAFDSLLDCLQSYGMKENYRKTQFVSHVLVQLLRLPA